jgi:hypothetical protein
MRYTASDPLWSLFVTSTLACRTRKVPFATVRADHLLFCMYESVINTRSRLSSTHECILDIGEPVTRRENMELVFMAGQCWRWYVDIVYCPKKPRPEPPAPALLCLELAQPAKALTVIRSRIRGMGVSNPQLALLCSRGPYQHAAVPTAPPAPPLPCSVFNSNGCNCVTLHNRSRRRV